MKFCFECDVVNVRENENDTGGLQVCVEGTKSDFYSALDLNDVARYYIRGLMTLPAVRDPVGKRLVDAFNAAVAAAKEAHGGGGAEIEEEGGNE